MGLNMEEMDAQVSIFAQPEGATAAVTLINKITAPPEQAEAHFMKTQPGFISTQLHRGSGVFVNVAEGESVAAFRAAFSHPEFRARLVQYPPGVCGGAEEHPH